MKTFGAKKYHFRETLSHNLRRLTYFVKQLRSSSPTGREALRSFVSYRRWARSQQTTSLEDGRPWIVFDAQTHLSRYLRPDMRVFEFGSGGSTLFFADRVREVVSIEHDWGWFNRVQEVAATRRLENACIMHIPPEAITDWEQRSPIDPDGYISSSNKFRGLSFHAYATAIESYPDDFFDLVLVDGRARCSCIKHAQRKVKSEGLLVLDNAERETYRSMKTAIDRLGWERKEYFGPGPYIPYFWQTTVWRKSHNGH